jgi:VanZ family protein
MNPVPVLRQFMRRPPRERGLLLRMALLFAAAHVCARVYSLDRARRRMQWLAVKARVCGSPRQIAWLIDRVNAYLPGRHSCLVHALCCEAAAAASGIATHFNIGAARGPRGHRFHAWVEHDGIVLTGDDHSGFVRMA